MRLPAGVTNRVRFASQVRKSETEALLKKTHILMTSLTLVAGMTAAAQDVTAEQQAQVKADVKATFHRFDHDKDGTITRSEYGGTPAAFDRFDSNYDGVITRSELEDVMLHPKTREDRLQRQDADGDGVISRKEFKGDDAAFARLDRNHDGVLSKDDSQGATRRDPGAAAEARFKQMDVNGDGQLTRDEWRGTDRTFNAKDKNSDGVLTLDEVKPEKKEG
jgi:Ca2+-binding EF-hand superfamily protein